MALHALAQCTARLLLAHQQRQGRQRAGGSGVGEQEGTREDWSVYCALADLGMEERVKGGWYVCIHTLRAIKQRLIVIRLCVRTALTLKVARCGARPHYMAGCAQSLHTGLCGATRYGSAEKTRQIIEAAAPKGSRGCAVHVRWLPSRTWAHESQCVTLNHC